LYTAIHLFLLQKAQFENCYSTVIILGRGLLQCVDIGFLKRFESAPKCYCINAFNQTFFLLHFATVYSADPPAEE